MQADPLPLWDTIKCKIRRETIDYAKIKQKKLNETLDILQRDIAHF